MKDYFTHTETDAGLYEFHHGDTVYGDDRPTRAEADRDEETCGETFDHDLVTDGPIDGMTIYTCRRCDAEIWEDDDPTERDNTAREDDAIDRADIERKERDR